MFSPRRRSSSCSSWAERKFVEGVQQARDRRPLPRGPHAGAWGCSRLVLAGVRDGVDHDVRQVVIGQPVEHLASRPLAGDHARGLQDLAGAG